ncbi:MAG: hypothetical protein VB075_00865, partial [Petrimonas sp.]|uniref:hypothetical protein n=1 Tax=Petrimonas sp. TaxID=2023866 RepID=UPI002B3FF4C5|nr:hypothetical protein [Petrimonas sp.]MEA5062686.1 hypothetical protein [Petrimonas sp.]
SRSCPSDFRCNLQFRVRGNSIPPENLADYKATSWLYAKFAFNPFHSFIPFTRQSKSKHIKA